MNHFDQLGKQVSEMDDLLDSWVKKLGINYHHFAVLYSLSHAENGQCTQKQIGEEWYVPKQTIFNICKEYREKGWIEFFESQSDKREKMMRLTELGKQQAEPIYQATIALFEKIFNTLGKQKTTQLFTLIGELNQIWRAEIEN
ncbi:MarR family transcriptional regulator [Rodentibacter trehalosifermentans]|uniref:MarR family transcriptional regulator n=2 Tax=Rodentibacter trehalosifermentans TaxID=1908263 RepID=A0A1V3ITS8_9PAST|nr:MarR family transcriptional regulator [Rodentibacter trehalosifermentans]OOF45688.1 MarR family transcriptional regulator [Rodentibacter trehalosifermentans]OOF48597.1 MarR family transcriptional regulator [Rodentibacter trehalosifermentans]